MKPPYPSFTSMWHDDNYPAIEPTRPGLSVKGKKVFISGGGAGIGKGIAQAFAIAGAESIVILGRRQALLEESKNQLTSEHPNTIVGWDILVSNAGYLPKTGPVIEAEEDEWWKGFEGSFNLVQALLPTRRPDATVICVNTGSIQVPEPYSAGNSSCNSSKFAVLKIFEILAVKNPHAHAVSMHPGVDMFRKGSFAHPHVDAMELPSHFAVWLCSEEAKFLRGKFVWANWDVEQMIAKKAEIEKSLLFDRKLHWLAIQRRAVRAVRRPTMQRDTSPLQEGVVRLL